MTQFLTDLRMSIEVPHNLGNHSTQQNGSSETTTAWRRSKTRLRSQRRIGTLAAVQGKRGALGGQAQALEQVAHALAEPVAAVSGLYDAVH